MSAIILRGERSRKQKFINDFIKENRISLFNLFEYKDPLKILEVRQIKKILGYTSSNGTMRVFIFYSDPTLVAQNALLKTIEELPALSNFIFMNEHELLPTILSRCQILNLGTKIDRVETGKNLEDFIGRLTSPPNPLLSILVFSEDTFAQDVENFEKILIPLRKMLVDSAKSGNGRRLPTAFRAYKALSKFLGPLYSNNLNERLIFEKALISEFCGA